MGHGKIMIINPQRAGHSRKLCPQHRDELQTTTPWLLYEKIKQLVLAFASNFNEFPIFPLHWNHVEFILSIVPFSCVQKSPPAVLLFFLTENDCILSYSGLTLTHT